MTAIWIKKQASQKIVSGDKVQVNVHFILSYSDDCTLMVVVKTDTKRDKGYTGSNTFNLSMKGLKSSMAMSEPDVKLGQPANQKRSKVLVSLIWHLKLTLNLCRVESNLLMQFDDAYVLVWKALKLLNFHIWWRCDGSTEHGSILDNSKYIQCCRWPVRLLLALGPLRNLLPTG